MSFGSFSNGYSIQTYDSDAVPQSLKSNTSAKAMKGEISHRQVIASTAAQPFSGSSTIQIACSRNSGVMIGGSAYLKLQVTGTGALGAGTYFKGASNTRGSAYSLINRIQLQIGNSPSVINLANAGYVFDQLLAHNSSKQYLDFDGGILLGSGQAPPGDGVTQTYILPLHSLFASSQGFPLFMVQGIFQLIIDYNSLNNSYFRTGGALAGTTVSIQATLCYSCFEPEREFVDGALASLQGDQKYVFPYVDYSSVALSVQANAQVNYMHGLNSSSLKGVVWSQIATADLNSGADGAQGKSISNSVSNIQVLCDGRLLNAFPLSTDAGASPQVFAELNRVYSKIYDVTKVDSSTVATFPTDTFAVGVASQRFPFDSELFSGLPAGTVQLSCSQGGTAVTMFICFITDKLLTIDGMGNVSLVH